MQQHDVVANTAKRMPLFKKLLFSTPWGILFVLFYGVISYRMMMFWQYAIFIFILLLICFFLRLPNAKNWLLEGALFALSAGFIFFLYYSELTACRAFYKLYESIHIGMKETAISRLIFERFPSGGQFGRLVKNTRSLEGRRIISLGLDPHIEPITQDYIHISMIGNRVAHKEWTPD